MTGLASPVLVNAPKSIFSYLMQSNLVVPVNKDEPRSAQELFG
jgi:hypothetical protein